MTSIKTRIETPILDYSDLSSQVVEEWHPLKQGLKLTNNTIKILTSFVEEWHPLKQGLKPTGIFLLKYWISSVEEWHPLKQGLKLSTVLGDSHTRVLLKSDIH